MPGVAPLVAALLVAQASAWRELDPGWARLSVPADAEVRPDLVPGALRVHRDGRLLVRLEPGPAPAAGDVPCAADGSKTVVKTIGSDLSPWVITAFGPQPEVALWRRDDEIFPGYDWASGVLACMIDAGPRAVTGARCSIGVTVSARANDRGVVLEVLRRALLPGCMPDGWRWEGYPMATVRHALPPGSWVATWPSSRSGSHPQLHRQLLGAHDELLLDERTAGYGPVNDCAWPRYLVVGGSPRPFCPASGLPRDPDDLAGAAPDPGPSGQVEARREAEAIRSGLLKTELPAWGRHAVILTIPERPESQETVRRILLWLVSQ